MTMNLRDYLVFKQKLFAIKNDQIKVKCVYNSDSKENFVTVRQFIILHFS